MVPIYAVSAWIGLCFPNTSYIDFIRQCYEAFVIYQFMVLLTQYLGGSSGVVEAIQYKPPIKWPFPLGCCKPAIPGGSFLQWLKYGALQYTIIVPTCAILAMITAHFDEYTDGNWSPQGSYPYITFIINVSQSMSLYCLVWLYVVLKNELAPFNPLYKALVVKSVVFFTFWQGVVIAFCADVGWINNDEQFQTGLQDFIICIEMFLAAAAHKYTFGYETYANGTMTLLMEQRALRQAELKYAKAVEEQQKKMKEMGILQQLGASNTDTRTLPLSQMKLTGGVPPSEEESEDDGEGVALFDDDESLPQNVIAPVIMHAMKAQSNVEGPIALARLDSDSTLMDPTSRNTSDYSHLENDNDNPFERTVT